MAAQLAAVRGERQRAWQAITVRQGPAEAAARPGDAEDFQEQLRAARAVRRDGFLRARRPVAQAAPATPEPTAPSFPPATGSGSAADAEEARAILAQCNSMRCQEGCEALLWNSRLADIAERAARGMARREVAFSHDGANTRFAEYPLSLEAGDTFGENLARSEGIRPLAAAVVKGWMESPGHRANLLGPFTACGLGAATDPCGVTFVVQLLARAPGDPVQEPPAQSIEGGTAEDGLLAAPRRAHSALLGLLSILALLAWKGGWLVVPQ
uniref:SCP domain-containing protein n=1 Tax=Alexandrium monilatum TaxID=311494 RepID=A0A7S4PXQ0_9DINO